MKTGSLDVAVFRLRLDKTRTAGRARLNSECYTKVFGIYPLGYGESGEVYKRGCTIIKVILRED